MVAAIISVLFILTILFAIIKMVKKREEMIAIKSGIIVELGMVMLTFLNSVLSGGTENLSKMIHLNLVSSSVVAIIVGVLFFWKKGDLYYYLDNNELLKPHTKDIEMKHMDDLKIDEEVEFVDKDFAKWQKQQVENQDRKREEIKARLKKDLDNTNPVDIKPIQVIKDKIDLTHENSFVKVPRKNEESKELNEKEPKFN